MDTKTKYLILSSVNIRKFSVDGLAKSEYDECLKYLYKSGLIKLWIYSHFSDGDFNFDKDSISLTSLGRIELKRLAKELSK